MQPKRAARRSVLRPALLLLPPSLPHRRLSPTMGLPWAPPSTEYTLGALQKAQGFLGVPAPQAHPFNASCSRRPCSCWGLRAQATGLTPIAWCSRKKPAWPQPHSLGLSGNPTAVAIGLQPRFTRSWRALGRFSPNTLHAALLGLGKEAAHD